MHELIVVSPKARIIRGEARKGLQLSVRIDASAPGWFRRGLWSVANTGTPLSVEVVRRDGIHPVCTAPKGVTSWDDLVVQSRAMAAAKKAASIKNFERHGLRLDQMENPALAVFSTRKI